MLSDKVVDGPRTNGLMFDLRKERSISTYKASKSLKENDALMREMIIYIWIGGGSGVSFVDVWY
jgi:hypothetical protein